ncbi:PDR/VanB family oxidoreductase [Pseudolabrys sp. FHR47]|uniref:PDR/VanB family oxidoreductase n=1 Tax=Pseudolabrys sp. FHR47 TaxID=2562284 RepID=UPI0019808865|nr:PDR/VanB family oxidoreductase [Pseudolabrys sp. FHR47]
MGDVAEMTKPSTVAAPRAGEQTFDVRLRALIWEAPGVLSLELASLDGRPLPAFEPGAHIDLKLPDGTLRQYSLCGDPNDLSHYRLGIRAVTGGQSSGFVHRRLRPGDVLTVSTPRNNFPLVASKEYIFVAGGIGVTPFIPMMRQLSARHQHWTLLYCNKRNEDAPFLKEIEALGGTVSLHASEAGTRLDVAQRLSTPQADTVVYCCGPEKLMLAVEEVTAGWPEGTVHFEWFAPRSRPADEVSGAFEVVCATSGMTLSVPPEKSILEVMTEAGIDVPRSCEQGICGTCECRIIEGEADHRDSILSSSERAANQTMMTCVSRAKGARLVLDV